LDDAAVLAAVERDPGGFLAGQNGPMILDEVQLAPDFSVRSSWMWTADGPRGDFC